VTCLSIRRENVTEDMLQSILEQKWRPSARTQARRRHLHCLHSSFASLTTVCCTPDQISVRLLQLINIVNQLLA